MKHSVSFIAVALLLFAASCVNDSQTETVLQDSYVQLSFNASFNNTKTAIDASSGKVSWCEGDIVRYYSKNQGEVSSLTVGPILNGGTTQIEPNIGWSDSFLVAVYGGSGVSDNSESAFTLTGAVTAEQSGSFSDSHLAIAKISKSGGSWPEAIVFSNIVPFLSFSLGNDAPAAEYAVFETLDGARIHADGKLLVSFDGNKVESVAFPAEGGGTTVRIPVSGAGTYYIALAPGTYNGFNISLYNSKGTALASVSSDKVLSLARGRLIKLGNLDGRLELTPSGQGSRIQAIKPVHQTVYNQTEAFEYIYAKDKYYKVDTRPVDQTFERSYILNGTQYGGTLVQFPQNGRRIPAVEGSNGRPVTNITAWTKNNGDYCFGRVCSAEYEISPTDCSIDDVTWSWGWCDMQNNTPVTSTDWQPSSPAIESYSDGKLSMSYTVSSADKMGPVSNNDLSYMRLEASFDNGTQNDVIVSDYEAVIPRQEAFHRLAFKLSMIYRSHADDCPLLYVNQTPHLYSTAKAAAEEQYTVPVTYNAGPFSLDIIDIHMKKPGDNPHENGEDERAYTITELQKYYPNLKLHFESVSYTLGSAGTEQDKFCDIYEDADGRWWFQPMYVNRNRADGSWDTSAACPKGDTRGISAVGRRPIVLVTLIDTANKDKVILEGYFKTEIVCRSNPTPLSAPDQYLVTHIFDCEPFGRLCNPQADPADPADFYNNYEAYDYRQETKWALFSNQVLEQTLCIHYNQFRSIFNWERCKTYVFNNKKLVPTDDYGRIIYVSDTVGNGGGINDKFVVLFRKENYDKFIADKITEKEIYAHFTSLGQGDVWLGFKVSIVGGPAISFAEKNPKNWFDDLTEKRYNQNIRIGAKVPNNSDVDVTRLDKFFDDNWVGNTVKLTLGSDQVSMYYKYLWGEMPVEYEYIFSKTQDNFVYPEYGDPAKTKTAKFYVSDDQKTVYIDAAHQRPVVSITRESYVRDNGVYVFDPPRNADKFTYLCNDYSKELLNAYAFKTGDDYNEVGEMLYFKVDLVATYGTCEIPCGTYTFPVRMIPPVSVRSGSAGNLRESPTGSNVAVGTLFRVFDYHNLELFQSNNNQYAENVVDGINLYRYYGAQSVSFDIDNAMTDQTGEYKYLFDHYANNQVVNGVNNEAKLWVADRAAPQTPVTSGPINISQVANLANYVLHYEYYGSDSDYHLRIPCTFTYKWGVVYGIIELLVEHNSTWN